MPRKPRDIEEGIHHVWVNATGHGPYFVYSADRITWIRFLVRMLDVYDIGCVAFCQMTTHVHFVLEVRRGVLPDAMRDLNREYAKEFNARHRRLGALDRKRYGNRRARSDEDLLGLFAYVVLNPVRERMCSAPAEWPCSSYRTTIGLDDPFPFVDARAVLAASGGRASLRGFVNREAAARARRNDRYQVPAVSIGDS
jgi:REP element-mobilizing transposase RayT